MTLGKLISTMRDVKGLTLRDMEEMTGLSNAVISQIETGHVKNPSFYTVLRIARALNVKLDELAKCK